MIIVNNSRTFMEDPIRKLNFEKFSNDDKTQNIILHLDCVKEKSFKKDENFKYYLLDLELPNRWINHDTRPQCYENEKIYDLIFSICPYVVKNRNRVLNKELYKYIFFPFPNDYIYDKFDKKYDLIYSGNSNFSWLSKINFQKYSSNIIGIGNSLANLRNVSYEEKINLYSKSRVSLTFNEYHLCDIALNNLRDLQPIEDYLEIREKKLTQHKSRVMESAFTKNIILCKKDKFNIIEDLFEENKEFIYFDDDNIIDIVDEIVNNYQNYKHIAENSYKKAIKEYSVECFYKKFILGDKK